MTITIEQNFYNPIPDIKQWWRKLVCKRKGHKYKPYKISSIGIFYDRMMMRMIDEEWREPYKQCTRCYKTLYKTVKEEKPKTIKFKRYAPLDVELVK